jgi:hypothetical protein
MYQKIDLAINQKRKGQGQTQQRAPIVRTDFTTFYNGVVLKNSDEMRINWEDYYQVRPADSVVTPGQQRPQTCSTLRDSHTTRTTVKQQQALYNGAVLEISNEKSTN